MSLVYTVEQFRAGESRTMKEYPHDELIIDFPWCRAALLDSHFEFMSCRFSGVTTTIKRGKLKHKPGDAVRGGGRVNTEILAGLEESQEGSEE